MLKVLAWVVSNDSRFLNGALNILERQHNGLAVVGITANNPIQIARNDKIVPFVPFTEINEKDYDVLLVFGAQHIGMSKVIKEASSLNFPEEKLLCDWIVCIPGFTLKKYRHLQRSQLSIFAMHCFGGLMSHLFGLSFRSPFVNLFLNEQDYLRFLHMPSQYLEEKLTLKEMKWQADLKFDYPIFMLDDVEIHMNHYSDVAEAIAKWNERKQRINWYNLFVTAYTESKEFLEEFDSLPYGKKVCFVPFKSDLQSAWYINPALKKTEQFWRIVNLYAHGDPFYYDPFDMLLYGKKTQLIDM